MKAETKTLLAAQLTLQFLYHFITLIFCHLFIKFYEKALVLGNNLENVNKVPNCITILISFYRIFNPFFQVATEKDFLDAINKVIKAYAKFSSTPKYMTYN